MRNVKADVNFDKAFPDELGAARRLHKKLGFMGEDYYKEMVAYTCKEAPNYIRKQTDQNSLWTLNECVSSRCALSRLENKARELFEHDVAQAALEQYKHEKSMHSEATINYVDVGCGGLFQTMRTLTLLLESGVSRINVHLVEPFFETYLKRKKITIQDNQRRFIQEETGYLVHEERFAQFAHWFKRAYPECVIRIFAYDSLDDYVAYTKDNSAMLANMYVGSDLDFSSGSSTIYDEIAQKESGFKETQPQGLLSYACVPREKVLKPHGIGMLLYKGALPEIAGLQHCIKILPKDVRPDTTHAVIVDPAKVPGQTRFMILDRTYDVLPVPIKSRL